MANINWTRIDERMIHGQVVTQWIRYIHFDAILLVDDGVAADEFMKEVVCMAAPSDVKVHVLSVDDAVEYLAGDSQEDVMILVRTPKTVERLVDKGVKIEKLNLGGMGVKPGRKKLLRNIAVSAEEAECFKSLAAKGVVTTYQMVPTDKPVEILNLL